MPPGLEFTNQPLNGGGPEKATNAAVAWPFDPSEAFHDVRFRSLPHLLVDA